MTELTWKDLLQKYNKGIEESSFVVILPNGNSLGVHKDHEARLAVYKIGLQINASLGYYDSFNDIDCLIQMMLKGKGDA